MEKQGKYLEQEALKLDKDTWALQRGPELAQGRLSLPEVQGKVSDGAGG